ncbi:MAG: moaA [Candidatus Saganbacteria bacterium]|uniref:MoaA n=1 Tax=Candidatus Saganbacteria bacterium TaxID=2575572 RepID=A0A833NYR4_UNCSA|nr:MAG: moaA [Candidatus Saganbacteria bacterium]
MYYNAYMAAKVCIYYITYECDAYCEFCDNWRNEKLQEIVPAPLEKHADNLKTAYSLGARTIEVTGGEPLVYEQLPQFLNFAKENKLNIQLFTNGINYCDRAKEIKGLTNKIFFSLDYPLADEHDRSRGTECFNKAIRAIRYAKELGEKPAIIYTTTRDSLRYLPEIIEIAEKLKIELHVNPVYDFLGLEGFEKSSLDYIKYFFKRPFVKIDLAVLEMLKNKGNKTAWPRCKAKETTITYLPDGKSVVPCYFNQGGRQGKEQVCEGCTRWPYMVPSFSLGFDKYRLLHGYSQWVWEKARNS